MATATCEQLEINDRCTVNVEWGDGSHRGKRVQIVSFQQNGSQTFARVRWLGNDSKTLAEQYGVLFNLKELRKVA